MDIHILHLLEGAKQARGVTVIIDVFRAFSWECYASTMGARDIIPVGDIEHARMLKRVAPSYLLAGERGGKRCEGFDTGNSPSQLMELDLRDRTIVHTTSAGTQGAANAVNADELLTGSLVNAAAIARYIRALKPEIVSLVCMGLSAARKSEEDTLCAEYIRALLLGEKPDISSQVEALRYTSGRKFFDPALAEVFPEADFACCTAVDRFDFVLRLERDAQGELHARRIDI